MLTELLLTHAEQHAAQAHATADMYIDWIGAPCTAVFWFYFFHRTFS